MRPVHGWGMRLARSAVVLVVAVVCWALFVKQEKLDPGRMAVLAVRTPHIHGLRTKPLSARTQPLSSSSVKAIRTAGKRQPERTGIYEVGWESGAKVTPVVSAGLLVELLPTPSLAASVLSVTRKQYERSEAVGADTYSLQSRFTVAGVPGATGVVFGFSAASGASSSGTATVVTFRTGTVDVLELVQSSGATPGPHQVGDLARAEWTHLQQVGTGLSLEATTRPLGWSLGLAGGAVVVAAGVATLPEWVIARRRRWRHRHEQRARERAHAERLARGRRAVRRHRAPAWQRQSRRGGGAWSRR